MYRIKDRNPENCFDDFFKSYGGILDLKNRWIEMSKIMPWDFIEDKYAEHFNNDVADGRVPISARVAFGAIYIKENENLTDRKTVEFIAENPYAQCFLGYTSFEKDKLFDPSMMVLFRRRFPANIMNEVNDEIHRRSSLNQKPPEDGSNNGELILDATVAPADIRYPNDVSLLDECRENVEKAIKECWDQISKHFGHMLPYNKQRARAHFLAFAKSKRRSKAKVYKARKKQLNYVALALERLGELLLEEGVKLREFWVGRLEVIKEIVKQQKEMQDERKNTASDRIVSVRQPHVRPIKRDKARTPTEFGQKITLSVVGGFAFIGKQSFGNFNEGKTLIVSVEEYYARFGCYPEAVIADQIYRTRENRAYCKGLGIRLSGPPLGRKKKDSEESEREQAYADSCVRNTVESRNGIAKRRFGLDLIMCWSEENALTEAVLNILAMNVAHLLRLSFCLFSKIRLFLRKIQFNGRFLEFIYN
jgi:hypothetical protein